MYMKKPSAKFSKKYDHSSIEKKWQRKWSSSKIFKSKEGAGKKYYALDMFPYPSGEGLHVGHPKGYIATDAVSRMKRMQGMNVLHPMGFDAFGLPAENYALKTKTHPEIAVKKNIVRFKKQLEILGFDYDWSREVNTTDPNYYKWTQWIFLEMWKKGLAYESNEPINWCPSCKTGLANEDIENGRCERCGTPVEKKPLRQWVLRITDYADRLLYDLDALDKANLTHIIDKKYTPRPGKKSAERTTVHALVRDPKTGKYLGLRWKNHPWTTFIVGGVEEGEDPIDAARREVAEETGYCDLKFIRMLGSPVKAEYYAAHKDVNRVAITTGVYFELASEKRLPVSPEEAAEHDTIWLEQKDMNRNVMTCAELPVWLANIDLTEEPTFITETGDDAFRPDAEIAERNAIMAIVKHWSEDKYISLEWKKVPWKTLITGGPENGQTQEEAAVAEIIEETGYLNPRLIRKVCRVHAKFFHVPKNLNRFAHFDVFYFELQDGKRQDIAKVENEIHTVRWIDRNEMFNHLTPGSHEYAWAKFLSQEMDHRNGSSGTAESEGKLLDWPESIKELQRNWIGRSEGAFIDFDIHSAKDGGYKHKLKVFTTRPDTLFGVTYVVLAPEHKLVSSMIGLGLIENKAEAEAYISRASSQTEIERTDAKKEKTGVELKGISAINPVNGEAVPVWIADYVLADYGTGAVMAVPAHDERDGEFAAKYKLPVRHVIVPERTALSGDIKYREGEPVVNRQCVRAAVKHWSEDKYILLKWHDNGWQTFISGGIEEGENLIESAKREIREETGFTDCEFVTMIGGPIRAKFYAPHKQQNRDDIQYGLLFKLKSDARENVKDEEMNIHSFEWASKDELVKAFDKTLVDSVFLDRLLRGETGAYVGPGVLINSGKFDMKDSNSVMKEITEAAGGKWTATYKLRDWVFSRQRYWGEPIPLVHCAKCGVVAVPEKELPVKLPKVKSYEPTGTGESPLASIDKWANVKCPKCKGPAKRETNTMPQWAGSCWYYLRYEDPTNKKELVAPKKEKYWSPVDLYVGGAEHATRHLIYARFWHKFLYDIGVVSETEPFRKLRSVGLIMGEDGRKMSKRFGNVVNPDDMVKTYGADTLRVYEMFMGPFEQQISWKTASMIGSRRFIERVWKLRQKVASEKTQKKLAENPQKPISRLMHRTVKKVGDDIEAMRFNTAISSLMIAVNEIEKADTVLRDEYETILKLLAPFAPHVTEELWSSLGNKGSIHVSDWPKYDPAMLEEPEIEIVLQINGKSRGSFKAKAGASDTELEEMAKNSPDAKKWLENRVIRKVIVVPGRLVNIVSA